MSGDKAARGARLGRLGSFALSAAIVLALSLAISLPLWSLATKRREAFTIAMGALALIAVASLIVRSCLRAARAKSRPSRREPL